MNLIWLNISIHLNIFMNKIQCWFSNSCYYHEFPTEVYINKFKEKIVNEMAISILFGLLEEYGAGYDYGYC